MSAIALDSQRSIWPKIRHLLSNFVWVLLTLLVLSVAALGIFIHTGHGSIQPVLTGSMRPDIKPGDLVVTSRVPVTSLHVGDVVVFRPPGQTLARVHRIASLKQLGAGRIAVTTKGDANADIDPWGKISMKGSTYRERFSIPAAGWVVANGGLRWLITGFAFIAGVLCLCWTWKYVRS